MLRLECVGKVEALGEVVGVQQDGADVAVVLKRFETQGRFHVSGMCDQVDDPGRVSSHKIDKFKRPSFSVFVFGVLSEYRARLGLLGREAPDGALASVGEPEGAEAEADTRSAPLFDDLVVDRVNLCDREVEHRRPDVPCAERDLAAHAGDAANDGGDELARLFVDAGYGSVALVESPDGACAGGEEAWLGADWDGGNDRRGGGIDLEELVVFVRGNPDEAVAEERIF